MTNIETWDWSDFWAETLDQINNTISEQEKAMWFSGLNYLSGTKNSITISVPSNFYKNQIIQRYGNIISDTFETVSGKKIEIIFEVKLDNSLKIKNEEAFNINEDTKIQTNTKPKNISLNKTTNSILNPDYTFDSFVIGENNSFAANAAYAISKNPGNSYNPCLFYGGVGLGKTHLIQSIGHSIKIDSFEMKVLYVTAEDFTNEFLDMVKRNKMQQFKTKYRNVDVLLIDDIHFLQNKDKTQEELFHTFNALYESKKQIAFTCDRPVSELKNITDRLKSRFERGLNIDLKPPSLETRQAILMKKMEDKGVKIPFEVIELISKNITTNVRDLESALVKLVAYSELVQKDITLEIAQEQLKDHFTDTFKTNISADLIQKVVSNYFNISTADLKSKKRTKSITHPRQIAMYILRELTESSTTTIGYEFGGRDHTTVMYACQKIENSMKTDNSLESTINNLIRTVKDEINY